MGTTSLRTLEAAWDGTALQASGATRLFIQPGYRLRTADLLLTNFHLPESTLFVLVSRCWAWSSPRRPTPRPSGSATGSSATGTRC